MFLFISFVCTCTGEYFHPHPHQWWQQWQQFECNFFDWVQQRARGDVDACRFASIDADVWWVGRAREVRWVQCFRRTDITYLFIIYPFRIYPFITHPFITHHPIITTHPYHPQSGTHHTPSHHTPTHPLITHPFVTHPYHPPLSSTLVTHPLITHPPSHHPPTLSSPTLITHPLITHPLITHPFVTHPYHPPSHHPPLSPPAIRHDRSRRPTFRPHHLRYIYDGDPGGRWGWSIGRVGYFSRTGVAATGEHE